MMCGKCRFCLSAEGYKVCKITRQILNHPLSKQIIGCSADSEQQIEESRICYNCKHWIGGGDFGLSCDVDYYNCNSDGFEKGCEKFKKKEEKE